MKLEGQYKTAKRRAARIWAGHQPAARASFEPVACSRISSLLEGIMLDGVISIEGTATARQQVADNSRFEQ